MAGGSKDVDALIDSLEVAFDAANARAEDVAAADLAASLMQGLSCRDAIERMAGAELVVDGMRLPLTECGEDYVVAGRAPAWIVPMARVVVVGRWQPRGLVAGDRALSSLLRAAARRGAGVEVVSDEGSTAGRLIAAGADHLRLARSDGACVVVGARALRRLRILDEGSADVA